MLSENQSAQLLMLAQCVNKKRITQQSISLATGVHQSQISRILAGRVRRSSPNVLTLCKYAETLGVSKGPGSDSDEGVMSVMRSLLGSSVEEDQRLRDVLSGLKAWRDSWRSKV